MTDPQHFIDRYLEDRDSLSEEELVELTAELRRSPTRVVQLRDQLLVEELLSQQLAVDRKNFLAQVRQRVRDYQRGEQELFQQAADLRQLALSQLETQLESKPPRRPAWRLPLVVAAAAAVLVLAVFAGLFVWRKTGLPGASGTTPIAVFEASPGVRLMRGGQEAPSAGNHQLVPGDQLITDPNAKLTVRFPDGTTVLLRGGSSAVFDLAVRENIESGKLVSLSYGAAEAVITPQPANRPMVFFTEVAQIEVLGTKIELHADADSTRLDVAEGRVRIQRLGRSDSRLVEVGKYAVVNAHQFYVRPIRWLTKTHGLVYLLKSTDRSSQCKDPHMKNLKDCPLTLLGQGNELPQDAADRAANDPFDNSSNNALGDSVQWTDGADSTSKALEFSGGVLLADKAAHPLWKECRRTNEMTVEVVLSPEQDQDRPDAAILSFAAENQANNTTHNFSLHQIGTWLVLRLSTAGDELGGPSQNHQVHVCDLAPNQQQHLVITYQSGALRGYLDGRKVYDSKVITGGFAGWGLHSLSLGGQSSGNHTWRGKLFGAALYHRALDEEEAIANSQWLVE